jgi:hypothetical protein
MMISTPVNGSASLASVWVVVHRYLARDLSFGAVKGWTRFFWLCVHLHQFVASVFLQWNWIDYLTYCLLENCCDILRYHFLYGWSPRIDLFAPLGYELGTVPAFFTRKTAAGEPVGFESGFGPKGLGNSAQGFSLGSVIFAR